MTIKTIPVDTAKYFDTPVSQIALLNDAFESGDAHYIAHSIGIIARARGMSKVAAEAGVTREALYKSLSKDGDPRLTTLLGVVKALGLKLEAHTQDAA